MTPLNKSMSGVESPCVRNCCLNEQDVCLGCFRHIDEILCWQKLNDEQKLAVIEQTKLRRAEQQRKGGWLGDLSKKDNKV